VTVELRKRSGADSEGALRPGREVGHAQPSSDGSGVFLTDAKRQFAYPDGKKQDFDVKAGQSQYQAAT
jgi:hypothetical protein